MMWLVLLLAGFLWLAAGFAAGRDRKRSKDQKGSAWLFALLGPATASLLILQAYDDGASSGGPLIGKTRILLTGVSVRQGAGGSVAVGADVGRDDLLIDGTPPQLLQISVGSRRAPEVSLLPQRPEAQQMAVVTVEGEPLGAAPATRAALCARPCSWPDAGLESPDSDEEMLYAPEGVTGGDPRARFFFAFSGRLFAQYGGASGTRASQTVPEGARIAIWTAAAPNVERGELARRLTLAQTLVIGGREGNVDITLDPPGIYLAEPGPIRLVAADAAQLPRTSRSLVLMPMLGASFGTLLQRVELTIPGVDADRTYVSGIATGVQRNDRVVLDDGEREVVLRVDRLTLASGLRLYAKWLVMLFVTCGMLLTWELRWGRPVAAMLFAAVETMLTLRLLIAVEGGMVEGTERAMQALPAALIALPLGTLAIVAALAPDRRSVVPAIGFSVMAGLALWLISKTIGSVPAAIWRQVAVLACIVATATLLGLAARPSAVLLDRLGRSAAQLAARTIREPGLATRGLARVMPITVTGAILLFLLRLLLVGFDQYEAIFIGGRRFALSIVFVPLTLIAAAPLLAGISRTSSAKEIAVGLVPLFLFWAIGVMAANLVAGDEGGALVLTLAIAIATSAAAVASDVPIGLRTWTGAAGLGLLVACFLAVLVSRSFVDFTWPMLAAAILIAWALVPRRGRPAGVAAAAAPMLWLAPLAATAATFLLIASMAQAPVEPDLDRVGAISGGEWDSRLQALLAPSRFAELTSDDAVNVRTTMVHLHDYGVTSRGRDFLNLPLVDELRRQQFSDYAAAIHLISPFGRLGAAGLILMLGGLVATAFGVVAGKRVSLAWSGALAIAGLAATSTYIILANGLAAPLTGRNVYLLAINSNSDLIEGLVLLAIAAASLGRAAVR